MSDNQQPIANGEQSPPVIDQDKNSKVKSEILVEAEGSKSGQFLKIFLSVLVFGILLLVGYWFYSNNLKTSVKESPQPSPQASQSQTSELNSQNSGMDVLKPTSLGLIKVQEEFHAKVDQSWSIFANEKLGISFWYPDFVTVSTEPSKDYPDYTLLRVTQNPELGISAIVGDGVKTETQLRDLYRKLLMGAEYPEECIEGLEKLKTALPNITQVTANLSDAENCAYPGYIMFFLYEEKTGKFAKWNVGHDVNITQPKNDNNSEFISYDFRIIDTFKFISN